MLLNADLELKDNNQNTFLLQIPISLKVVKSKKKHWKDELYGFHNNVFTTGIGSSSKILYDAFQISKTTLDDPRG